MVGYQADAEPAFQYYFNDFERKTPMAALVAFLFTSTTVALLGTFAALALTAVLAAIFTLHQANPSFGARRLYRAGLVIGRDHIASTVNTLVLAYAGASLPLLLLFTQAGRRLTDVAVGELVGVEVVRTLVGSVGLVAGVPITTGLAAIVVTGGITPTPTPRPGTPEPDPSDPTTFRMPPADDSPGDAEGAEEWARFNPGG